MKNVLSIIIAIVIMLSTCLFAFAYDTETKTDPIVLVHGMMGWGENAYGEHELSYWGMEADNDYVKKFREAGYEVYAPSVGPMSSAWDRACELFAQLTGTVVDYGAAHSEKFGHSRYGRDYTGKGYLSSDWYKTEKINLVGHSFGGPTIIVFTSLMAYGSAEEKAASPDDCSPLFEGNHGSAVYTVTTLESPSNGTMLSNLMNDTYLPVFAFGLMMNIEGTKSDITTDYMFDQWGLTCDPSTGETASFNPSGIFKVATSEDHCAYDMSLQGAREICEKYQPSEDTYYFSVAANLMEENSLGMVVPSYIKSFFGVSSAVISMLAGKTYHGIKTDKSWAYNDGLVPVPSALYPYSQPHEDYDGVSTDNLKKGVWYSLPVVEGNHGYGCMGDINIFWTPYFERLSKLYAS